MDKTIRKNEICIIGLPRCDFVFSSTRSCFIAYGFRDSTLEMTILRHLLEQKGIVPVEAGGSLAPGQHAFCAKICSKIITSQFCIVLINNEETERGEIPNANVNMEYGLMLGFNKYIIPFQRASQTLPFNIAGLDTIKYNNQDFERLASTAIEQAIQETRQDAPQTLPVDQGIGTFLLAKGAIITNVNNPGDRDIYQLGAPLGFNLLNDFTGMRYTFLGNFTTLRPETVVWRINMLTQILEERRASIGMRVKVGLIQEPQVEVLNNFFSGVQIWILVTSDADKTAVQTALQIREPPIQVFSLDDVRVELERLQSIGR
jgi:Predicted nucleotide-binding protein containing TIR-like domain